MGAGITSILFFVTLKKIHAIVAIDEDKEDKHSRKKYKNNGDHAVDLRERLKLPVMLDIIDIPLENCLVAL